MSPRLELAQGELPYTVPCTSGQLWGEGSLYRLSILNRSVSVSLVLDRMFVCPRCEPDLAADCQVTIILISGLLG